MRRCWFACWLAAAVIASCVKAAYLRREKGCFVALPVVRGARAKVLGYVQLFVAVPLFGLSAWGAFQAESLVMQSESRSVSCVPNPSIERTVAGKPAPAAHVER